MPVAAGRSPRNTFLAAAAAVGAVAAALQVGARAFSLSDTLSSFFPTYYKVISAFGLVGAVFMLCAFVVALDAFTRRQRARRTLLLAASAALFAGYGSALLTSGLIATIKSGTNTFWTFTASGSAGAGSGLALFLAASLVAFGVVSSAPNGLLGRASAALAGFFVLSAAAYAFELAGLLDVLPLPTRVSGGFATTAAGHFVAGVAALIAVRTYLGDPARRERGLGAAAAVFALGFLVAGIGAILTAVHTQGATSWLQAVSFLVLAAAAATGVAAFSRSARAAQPS